MLFPQVMEERVVVERMLPRERIQRHTAEEIMDVLILETQESWQLSKCSRSWRRELKLRR